MAMKSTLDSTIPLDKRKIGLRLLGAAAFVGLGLWLLLRPPALDHGLLGNPTGLRVVGLLAVLVFGLFAGLLAQKLVDPAAGLILSEEGLWDNAGGLAAGLVRWADITELKVVQQGRQPLILVMVRHPQVYIDRQGSGLKRRLMQANLSAYGSPISLSAGTLAMDFAPLYALLQQRLAERTA